MMADKHTAGVGFVLHVDPYDLVGLEGAMAVAY